MRLSLTLLGWDLNLEMNPAEPDYPDGQATIQLTDAQARQVLTELRIDANEEYDNEEDDPDEDKAKLKLGFGLPAKPKEVDSDPSR